MLATYHNHSRWSDGKASAAELLAAAADMNIGELGISDHWVLHPDRIQPKWAMPTERLHQYVEDILALRDIAAHQRGPVVRLGLEVDWFPNHGLPLREILDKQPFDYLIGSVHEIRIADAVPFMIDGSPAAWQPLTPDQRDEIHRQYWINMKSLAQSGIFDIVAHIDLPKKFAFYSTIDLSREIGEALDVVAAARTKSGNRLVVEINTAGWHKPCRDAYPTLDILRECNKREIPVTISADAHQPDHLLRDFDRAAKRLAQAGYTEIARFDQRQSRFEPLDQA